MPEPTEEVQQSPGTLAPKEGPQHFDYLGPKGKQAKLPQDLQDELRDLCKKFAGREMYARLWEIQQARLQRLFERGIQHLFWNADENSYQIATTGGGGGNGDSQAAREPTSFRSFNIYLGYEKSFESVFTQNQPTTRFEPEDPKNANDITAAAESEKMSRVIQKFNNPKELQTQIGRYLYTDGRVVAHTRFVTDGQRFGFEDEGYPQESNEGVQEGESTPTPERVAKGQELISIYGVLETKVPISARSQNEWDYCQISGEYPISRMKAAFPDIAEKISQGTRGSSEQEYARNARIATAEGTLLLSQTGDSMTHLVTFDRTWIRPSAFYELEKASREKLISLFPDGCYVAFVGETYCESRNESMDDHLAVNHALPGDGQSRPSLGASMVPVQEEFNDGMNLAIEAFKYTIPATWCDQEAIDVDAIQEQASEYGAHYPFERKTGESAGDYFYTETPIQPPAELLTFLENLQGPLAQFLTAQQPALFGAQMEDQKTKGGYQMARDMALGQMGLIWRPFTEFWAKVMLQAVRCAANNRDEAKPISAMVAGDKGQETVDVDIQNLKGNILAFPETDENFPESWTQKSNKYMGLLQAAQSNPLIAATLSHPENQALGKDYIGLDDLVIPDADSNDKQLEEIAEMKDQPPIPNQQAIQAAMIQVQQAQITGQQVPPPDPDSLMQSSVPIDPKVDDNAIEAARCKSWLNSRDGRKAKRENQDWYQNVRLHMFAHEAADAAQKQGPQNKPPSEAISFKDLPPDGQMQMAQQAGIQLNPQLLVAEKVAQTVAKQPPPNGKAPQGVQ